MILSNNTINMITYGFNCITYYIRTIFVYAFWSTELNKYWKI